MLRNKVNIGLKLFKIKMPLCSQNLQKRNNSVLSKSLIKNHERVMDPQQAAGAPCFPPQRLSGTVTWNKYKNMVNRKPKLSPGP